MIKIWNPSASRSLEPTSVLHAIKSVFPAFRGFQQHDSQVVIFFYMIYIIYIIYIIIIFIIFHLYYIYYYNCTHL